MSRSWFSIKNAAEEEAEISIYDEIGGWGVSARYFISMLRGVTAKKIALRIHSPGGSVFEGNAIYNALKRHPASITAHIDGLAASMASVIALAADRVCMASNAMFMIHNPSLWAQGDAEQMRKNAKLLDQVKVGLVAAYVEKTGKTAKEIESLMDATSWFTAAEAKAAGFIDEITGERKLTACFDLKNFANVPAALAGWSRETTGADNHSALLLPESEEEALTGKDVDTVSGGNMAGENQNLGALTNLQLQVLVNDLNRKMVDLEARVPAGEKPSAIEARLTAEVETVKKERDQLTADLTARDTEIANLKASVTTVTAERDQLKASNRTASEQAVEIVADQGVPPVDEEPKGGGKTKDKDIPAPVSMADFKAMHSVDKAEFIRKGGRITE